MNPPFIAFTMDHSIRRRLLTAEEEFLSATLSDSDAAAEGFSLHWHRLMLDWEEHNSILDEETISLAHATSSRITMLAEKFLDYQGDATSLSDSLEEEVVAICYALDDSLELTHEDTAPITDVVPTKSQPYVTLSAPAWLLQNLHNPYPPPALKESMKYPIDSPAKSVNEWFTKARQRIGWTRLMRDRFDGSRSAAIEAAFRAYIRDDPTNPLDEELLTAFLAIKSHAELVFSQNSIVDGENSGRISACSSERSRSVSPAPSLTFSLNTEDSDEDVPSFFVPRVGQKRSISHSSEDAQCFPGERPSKRPRSQSSIFSSDPIASTIRVPTSDFSEPHTVEESSTSPQSMPSTSHARKRRLSDAAVDNDRPKRPRGQEGERPQVVSDPFPLSSPSSLEAWFNSTFETPSPATTDPIDTNSWDMEFFNAINFTDAVYVPSKDSMSLSRNSTLMNDLQFEESNNLPYAILPDLGDLSSTIPVHSQPSSAGFRQFAWNDYINFDAELENLSSSESGTVSVDAPPTWNQSVLSPGLNHDIRSELSLPPLPFTTSKTPMHVFDIKSILDTLPNFCSTNPGTTLSSNDDGIQVVENWLAL